MSETDVNLNNDSNAEAGEGEEILEDLGLDGAAGDATGEENDQDASEDPVCIYFC